MSITCEDLEFKNACKMVHTSKDVMCDITKNETIHTDEYKQVDKISTICDKLNIENSSTDAFQQVESICEKARYLSTDQGDPGSDHKLLSKYASLLRQLTFTTLIGLNGVIMGTFLAYPAVALVEEGSDIDGIQLSAQYTKWFVSIPLLVSIPGCAVAGTVIETLGIRRTLACCWVFSAISWAIITVTTAIPALFITRLLQGISSAVTLVAQMTYPAEIGCTKYRGFLLSLLDVQVYFGVMTTYVLALFIDLRYLGIVLGALFLIPHGIGLYVSPESPVWLIRQNRIDEAKKALIQLRGSKDSVEREIVDIQKAVEEGNRVSTSVYEQIKLLRNASVWKPMLLCILLVTLKELTGQSAITSYTIAIFKMTNTTLDLFLCTAALGIIRLLSCFLSIGLIHMVPRKVLLTGGFFVSGIAMGIMAFSLLGQAFDYSDYLPNWLPLMGLMVFSAVFSSCVNPTAWAVIAELTPSSIKAVGGGIITTIFSIIQFLINLTFFDLVYLLGAGGTFMLFTSFGLLGGMMVLIWIPETRGKSLAQLKRRYSLGQK